MNRSAQPQNATAARPLPKKWVVILVVLALGYALLQPLANRQFGWQLPSLQALLPLDRAPVPRQPVQNANSNSQDRTDSSDKVTSPPASTESDAETGRPTRDVDPSAPLYGVLRAEGREVYVSPAGLRYTRGSEEGHRLKHLQRHLADQPERPGRHGVFNGDMPQVLRWIDDGYQRARQSQPGTSQRQEQGRTVYEADFPQPIGFVGGREGNRRGRPATKQLRVVTEEDRVITAFPF